MSSGPIRLFLAFGLAVSALAGSAVDAAAFGRIFVSSPKRGTDLGGLAGADAVCQGEANAQSLGGTWVAWLSTSTVDAKDRIGDFEYRLVDGVTVIANNKADLTDGTLAHRIDQHANGGFASRSVWTGTLSDGTAHPTNTCSGWTAAGGSGRFGQTLWADSRWTNLGDSNCVNILSLYCFEAASDTPDTGNVDEDFNTTSGANFWPRFSASPTQTHTKTTNGTGRVRWATNDASPSWEAFDGGGYGVRGLLVSPNGGGALEVNRDIGNTVITATFTLPSLDFHGREFG